MNKSKRSMVLLALATILTAAVGCESNSKPEPSAAASATASTSPAPTQTAGTNALTPIPQVNDSTDIPTWTGKQLKLTFWNAHGTGTDMDSRVSEGDVVTPELKRVTGVEIDRAKSFDNAGQTATVKMGLLAASGDWPDVVLNPEEVLKKLVDADKVYDLTELLPKYAPNLMRRVPNSLNSVWNDNLNVSAGVRGKIYAVPTMFSSSAIPALDSTVDPNKFPGQTPYQTIYVRDDIIKKLYPNAKTMKEIEDLYVKNGKFTKEDLLDVPINSEQDFLQFLRNIKALGIKEGNKEVSPFPVYAGQDNWALMTFLFGALDGATLYNDYFSYWDKETQKMQWGFKQPYFKNMLLDFNRLVREGVAAKESLVDPFNVFLDKLGNGEYAMTYAWLSPDNAKLKTAGKPYQYRPVVINVPVNDKKFVYPADAVKPLKTFAIFKDKVKPEDVPQILRYFDYQMSEVGEKMNAWGPKSAGLFDENNGQRTFKDKDLEAHMVYGAKNDKGLFYNLYSGFAGQGVELLGRTTFSTQGKFAPTNTYTKERKPEEASAYFTMARVAPQKGVESLQGFIGNFTAELPEADKAWKARQSVEAALTKILAASSDTEFEKLYNDMVQIADKAGYNDDTLTKLDQLFRQKNAPYMNNIK